MIREMFTKLGSKRLVFQGHFPIKFLQNFLFPIPLNTQIKHLNKFSPDSLTSGPTYSSLGFSISAFSSSIVALNPNSFPGVNDDCSSSADWVVLILFSFTVRFS